MQKETADNALPLPSELNEKIFSFLNPHNSLKLASKNLYRLFHEKCNLETNPKGKILYVVTNKIKIVAYNEESIDSLVSSLNESTDKSIQNNEKFHAFHSLYHALEYIAWMAQQNENDKHGEYARQCYLPGPTLWVVKYRHEVDNLNFLHLRIENKKTPTPDYLYFAKNQHKTLVWYVELPLSSFSPIIGVSIVLQAEFGHYTISQTVNMRDYLSAKSSVQSSSLAIQSDKKIVSNTSYLLWQPRETQTVAQAKEKIKNINTHPIWW